MLFFVSKMILGGRNRGEFVLYCGRFSNEEDRILGNIVS